MNLVYCLRNNDAVTCIELRNSFLLTGSDQIRLWNLKNGKMVSKLHDRSRILKIQSFKDRIAIHARDDCIQECSWPYLEKIDTIRVNTCNFCAFDRDQEGNLYVPADNDSNKIQIMDSTHKMLKVLSAPHNAGILMCLFTFVHCKSKHLAAGFEDGSIGIWDLESGICKIYKNHTEPVLSVYVIEGIGIVSGGADCKLAIRYFSNDLITCDFIELDHVKGVSCLTFSASKLLIAAGGWDGRGRINDVVFLDDPKRSFELEDAEDWICPNDSLIVGSEDGRVSIWEI